jgi:hypothetical protein
MLKTRKLRLDREVLAMLSTKELKDAQGGVESAAPAKCEPSGIVPCRTKAGACD